MIRAPASLASQGQISGIGLAQAKIIASLAIPLTHSGKITPGPDFDNEMQTSAPFRASAMPPLLLSGLVLWHRSHLYGFPSFFSLRSALPVWRIALLSTTMV